jgi:hypothetical protein
MIDFLNVEATVRNLKKKVEAGQITPAAFEAELLELVDVAEDGYYWMFGHKTGQWYRHDGTQWLPDSPGELLVSNNHLHRNPLPQPAADWASLDMGWFSVSLTLLVVLFLIVYTSAL